VPCIVILESLEMLRAFCIVKHVETLFEVLCIVMLAALSMLGQLVNSSSSASDVDALLCVAVLLHCLPSDGSDE